MQKPLAPIEAGVEECDLCGRWKSKCRICESHVYVQMCGCVHCVAIGRARAGYVSCMCMYKCVGMCFVWPLEEHVLDV